MCKIINFQQMIKHFKEEQPARTIRAAESPIRLCVFVSQEAIAYVPGSYKVSVIMIIVIIFCTSIHGIFGFILLFYYYS